MKAVTIVLASCLLLSACSRSQEIAEREPTRPDFSRVTKLLDSERQINAVIVSQRDSIVYEYYLSDSDRNRIYNYYSVAKSVTSIIAGIAIDTGYIRDEDVPISDYFPALEGTRDPKGNIRLRHLLSMTSGLSWPESTDWNHFFRPMVESGNWIDFILSRDLIEVPGTAFNYNSGNHHLVSKIVQETTRQNMLDFGKARLFDKLGITSVSWYEDPQGICFGGAWIRMRAKDALKIGQLILDEGNYGNESLVSTEWVNKMTTPQSEGYRWDEYVGGEYGYGWWINTYRGQKTVYAWGANEQYIFITPSLSLVAVFNSEFRNQKATRPPYIYSEIILGELLERD